MKISYLQQGNIDKKKWDQCIDKAPNGLIYAYSFYLDAVSKHWDALVLGNYETVMPLTWNRKYSFYYLYQPFFTASLGIFGSNISAETVRAFLESIPSKFKLWEFNLNEDNLFSIPGFPMYERSNYVLSLKDTYENIAAHYAQSHTRNIKRAIKFGNVVKRNIPLHEVITLAKEQSKNFSAITDKDYKNFSDLFQLLQQKNEAVTFGIVSSQEILVASCVFFFSHGRAYYILVGNHPDGRTSGASHLLIDAVIKEYAGRNLLLDFEGSSIQSLAFFYKSFGAHLEKYPAIKLNRLPAVVKLFK